MQSIYFISPLASLLLTYLFIPFFSKMAFHFHLVDKPNQRKVHQRSIPLIGGISIFIASSLVMLLSFTIDSASVEYKNIYIATFILLLMGVIDDRFDLSAALKLSIQLILAHFIFIQGIKIESLHGLMGIYTLAPKFQYVLTVIVITGVVNAFNLMDGIDGLAAGIAILGFTVLGILSILTSHAALALLCTILIGSLSAFLRYNLSHHQKIFMGDAGSLALGFILVVSGIYLVQSSQNSQYVDLVTMSVMAIFIVPVLDAARVFIGRAMLAKSPFHADKTHLHHLVLGSGLRHKPSTVFILTIIALTMVIGYINHLLFGFTMSIVSMLFMFHAMTKMLLFNNKLLHWKNRIIRMESYVQ